MVCLYEELSNIGLLCNYGNCWNKKCSFVFKKKTCPDYKQKRFDIRLEPIKPTPPPKDYSKEVEKLYWKGVDPMTIENEELREQLITRIVLEHEANEDWRLYR